MLGSKFSHFPNAHKTTSKDWEDRHHFLNDALLRQIFNLSPVDILKITSWGHCFRTATPLLCRDGTESGKGASSASRCFLSFLRGDWVKKMAIRAAIVSWRRKDWSDISLCHKDGKKRSHIFSVLLFFISTLRDLLFKSLLTPLQSNRPTV